jgi:DNA-binding NarL/FixJ family response regulator
MKILVVDDHALIREALRGVLKELKDDATVLEASDWREATRLLHEHCDLGLILLDLSLPDKNGFAALAELRGHYRAIPIVVLSAFNDRANVVKALDLGTNI